MDLFPVQRYLGEEENSKDEESAAAHKLEKLLSKVKLREKNSSGEPNNIKAVKPNENQSNIHSSSDSSTLRSPKKKFKKSKSDLKVQAEEQDRVEQSEVIEKGFNKLKVVDQENESEDEKRDSNQVSEDDDAKEAFPVIGDYKFKKKKKVKRVLPDWLANPSVVSVDLQILEVSVEDIAGLHEVFRKTLRNNKITHFFPVQAQVIPWLLKSSKQSSIFWPSDICVSAPTGSGKTLAYVLPILQSLMGNRTGQIRALVVLPVQELASQVASVFRSYSVGTGLRIHLSTGGLPLQEDRNHLLKQRLGVGWESQVDILVITPGRLVEHLYSTPGFSLSQLQFIVIDEADRIVDSMQNNWLHHLDQRLNILACPNLTLHNLKTMPRRAQKLLFSATLSIDPEKLNHLNLFQPRLFTSVVESTKDKESEGEFIGKFTTPAELAEQEVRCSLAVKPLVLYQLIARSAWSRVLVFVNSGRAGHQLTALLKLLARNNQRNLTVQEISMEVSPNNRKLILNNFEAGKVDVLVCTDKLARGIDIPNVKYVVSYDMPKHVRGYVHRVGRTGRAGQQGTAITMVQHTQAGLFKQMLQTAGKENSISELLVSNEELKPLEHSFKDALKQLKTVTEGEASEKLKKTKSIKRVVASKKGLTSKRKHNKNLGNAPKRFKAEKS